MKIALVFVFLASSAFAQDLSVAAAESACGPSNVEFGVRTNTDQSPLQQPEPRKALVYVVEDQRFKAIRDVTIRVGFDGNWIGATRGNSYVFFSVGTGEHHLCVDWASSLASSDRLVSLANLTAESGKVYYFRARTTGGPGALGDGRWQAEPSLDLDLVNSDEGKLLVASYARSVSYPRK